MATIKSIIMNGSDGVVIDAECQTSNGLPAIVIVGLGNKAVSEAKERIRSAFASARIPLPRKRITINLAPADVPKESTSLDLAMAGAILAASGQAKHDLPSGCVVLGELGLDGLLRPIRGIIGKIIAARTNGITTIIVPTANLQQALLVPGVTILSVQGIRDLYLHLNGQTLLPAQQGGLSLPAGSTKQLPHYLSEVIGQAHAKRALIIAAGGGHNLLLHGPPGTGKSMLAKTLISLLPAMSHEEVLEVTHLYSLIDSKYDNLMTSRPFRSPHHSASTIAMTGGGNNALPGEITLSHRGVLLLDEMPEFTRETLEALRQPLEDRVITVSRAKATVRYPANFILAATANPCPCGFYASTQDCECATSAILRYQRKLSGPILDRIDLHVAVEAVSHDKLLHPVKGADDTDYRAQVLRARERQLKRFGGQQLNANMTNAEVKQYALLKHDAETLLNEAATRLRLSPRVYIRLIKVARTIADLDNSQHIVTHHILEALQYRNTSFAAHV